MELSAQAEAWRARGRRLSACGHEVFVVDEGEGSGPPLLERADVVEVVARQLGLGEVQLWAHDMGTSVATELLARRAAGLPI